MLPQENLDINPDYSLKGVMQTYDLRMSYCISDSLSLSYKGNSLENYNNPLNKLHGQASNEFRLRLSYHIETQLKLWK